MWEVGEFSSSRKSWSPKIAKKLWEFGTIPQLCGTMMVLKHRQDMKHKPIKYDHGMPHQMYWLYSRRTGSAKGKFRNWLDRVARDFNNPWISRPIPYDIKSLHYTNYTYIHAYIYNYMYHKYTQSCTIIVLYNMTLIVDKANTNCPHFHLEPFLAAVETHSVARCQHQFEDTPTNK